MENNMNIFERITLVLHISYDYLNDGVLEQVLFKYFFSIFTFLL